MKEQSIQKPSFPRGSKLEQHIASGVGVGNSLLQCGENQWEGVQTYSLLSSHTDTCPQWRSYITLKHFLFLKYASQSEAGYFVFDDCCSKSDFVLSPMQKEHVWMGYHKKKKTENL